jgi:CHAT domain-containing protein
MIAYPPPTGDLLTPNQCDVLQRIETCLSQKKFDQSKIKPHLPDLIGKMAAVCVSGEEQKCMAKELDRVVRWRRLTGYWLTFLFQLAMQQAKSLVYFPIACCLYADAQINANDDLSLSSLENGYNILAQLLRMSKDEDRQLRRCADDLRRRMHLIYQYYRQWHTSLPYSEINPLTEHLYSEKTFVDLVLAFPQLDKPRSQIATEDYLSVIEQCRQSGDIYCCIVTRRFLGSLYQGQGELEAAREHFQLGLEEAQKVALETEIGHFHRLYGDALHKTGQLQEAAQQFESAFNYESNPMFSYWKALSARELGDVRMRMFPHEVDLANPPAAIEQAAEAYKAGRLMFEANIGMGVVPAARAVKQQLCRSYTDNALQAAMVLQNAPDTIAEIEAAGPRYATELVAEGKAVNVLPADVQTQFRRARAVFHQYLSAFNEKGTPEQDFYQYVASVEGAREARRLYLNLRNELTVPVTHAQLSDKIAQKILALRLPNVIFLLFHVGQEQTFGTLLDASSGQIAVGVTELGERHWRSQHEAYQRALRDIRYLPNPIIGMSQLLNDLLSFYEDSLTPLLEPFLPFLEGKHLKIFPRLFLNEVPFHALTVGGKRLIEYCNISYAQTLGLFLQVHQQQQLHQSAPSASTLTMIWDDKGTPFYRGTAQQLNSIYADTLRVLQNPSWQEFTGSLHDHAADFFFACHGQYDPDDSTASQLHFGESEEATFSRIFSELNLTGCQCVTLGACESGLGRTSVTAEYLGLPIAFFAAGVRYVIGSLWKVNQLASAILLGYHYELLYSKQYTIPGALNQAQRLVMQMSQDQAISWVRTNLPDKANRLEPLIQTMENAPFAHPYYWAGFYVAGDV